MKTLRGPGIECELDAAFLQHLNLSVHCVRVCPQMRLTDSVCAGSAYHDEMRSWRRKERIGNLTKQKMGSVRMNYLTKHGFPKWYGIGNHS